MCIGVNFKVRDGINFMNISLDHTIIDFEIMHLKTLKTCSK
jgi:hypothetical protein